MKKVILITLLTFSTSVISEEIGLICNGKELTLINNKNSERQIEKTFVLNGKKLYEGEFMMECVVSPGLIQCFKEHPISKTTWNVSINRVSGKVDMFSTNPTSTIIEEYKGTCKKVNNVF